MVDPKQLTELPKLVKSKGRREDGDYNFNETRIAMKLKNKVLANLESNIVRVNGSLNFLETFKQVVKHISKNKFSMNTDHPI